MNKIDKAWLGVARSVSRMSDCDSAKVGAVILDSTNRIVSTGYNNPAKGFCHSGGCSGWCERAKTGYSEQYGFSCPAIHAEANALLFADKSKMTGGTCYVTALPCFDCLKLLSNSGISRLVFVVRERDRHRAVRESIEYMQEIGIQVTTVIE